MLFNCIFQVGVCTVKDADLYGCTYITKRKQLFGQIESWVGITAAKLSYVNYQEHIRAKGLRHLYAPEIMPPC